MTGSITTRRDGDVLVVTLDRDGDELNRIDGSVHHDLTQLFSDLRQERKARAIVLTAVGRAFSAGGEFSWFETLREPGRLIDLQFDARRIVWDLLDVPAPVVCALNGHAVGLGASIALLCDAVFMAESATISDPHVKVGIVAGDGGTVAWPLAIGPMRAKRYLLTGEAVTAADAARMGLVTEAVPDAEVEAHAMAFARKLAAGAPLAIRYTKQAANQSIRQALLTAFDLATHAEMLTFTSEDHAEALAAIREHRPPVFRGV